MPSPRHRRLFSSFLLFWPPQRVAWPFSASRWWPCVTVFLNFTLWRTFLAKFCSTAKSLLIKLLVHYCYLIILSFLVTLEVIEITTRFTVVLFSVWFFLFPSVFGSLLFPSLPYSTHSFRRLPFVFSLLQIHKGYIKWFCDFFWNCLLLCYSTAFILGCTFPIVKGLLNKACRR